MANFMSAAGAGTAHPLSSATAGSRRLLLHCPDITLKGRNQEMFQQALVRNIRHALRKAGMDWPVGSARGRVYVDATAGADTDIETAVSVLEKIAGVSSLGASEWLRPGDLLTAARELNWPLIEDVVVRMAGKAFVPDRTFAVRVNRVDKTLPGRSQDMERRLGDVIRAGTGWGRVNLTRPDQTFHLDAYPDGLYIYPEKYRGIGGLPVGTGGRVLALLSGGIDSPVAAFMLAKRGCTVEFFHMSAGHPRGLEPETSVVAQLARELSRFCLRTRLHVVPYTFFDLALTGDQEGYELVLFRRFLLRCAEHLARRIDAGALITGDSLGQVASQTLENLAAAAAPIGLPIFRPLIGMNKQEIIEQARRIGTYEISIQPYKDCCALIGRHPRTRSDHAHLCRLEEKLFPDYEALIRDTFRDALCLEFDCGAPL